MIPKETLGTSLRELRQARGVGIRELARLAGTSKRSVQDWETDRYVPSGAALDRVLGALEAPEGHRARLLALAAPGYARVALADTRLGPPVDVGGVLRAMRLRQGTTQAEVARAAGVSQATLARWESGDASPSGEALHWVVHALGASPEEALALLAVEGRRALEGDLGDVRYRVGLAVTGPLPLRDVLLLGIESELWWRAAGDPAAEPMLSHAVAARAHQRLMAGALDELDALARRVVRMVRSARDMAPAASAVYAACWARQRLPGGAAGAARSLGRWSERMDDPQMRAWLQSAQSLAIVRADDAAQGLERLERLERDVRGESWSADGYFLEDLFEARVLAGQPERALDLVPAMGDAAPPQFLAKAHLALGEEPAEALAAARAVPVRSWPQSQEMEQIERGVERVRRGGRARFP